MEHVRPGPDARRVRRAPAVHRVRLLAVRHEQDFGLRTRLGVQHLRVGRQRVRVHRRPESGIVGGRQLLQVDRNFFEIFTENPTESDFQCEIQFYIQF